MKPLKSKYLTSTHVSFNFTADKGKSQLRADAPEFKPRESHEPDTKKSRVRTIPSWKSSMARRAYPPSTTTHRHFSSREENGRHTSSSRDLLPPPPLPPKPTRHHRSQHDSRIVFSNDYNRDHSAEPDQKVLKKELDSKAQNNNNDRKSPKTRHKITIF